MAFQIMLQVNISEKRNVTKILNDFAPIEGVLKEGTSIIDPAILIAKDLSEISGCNYLTIPTFGRMYFVNNIIAVRNNLCELHCHVDVLSTYADQIKTNSGIVKRQKDKWNLYLNDGSLKVYQNQMVLTKAFPSGFSTQEFVLAVAGSA